MPRKSEGRQKIEIKKIENESSSAVAFSKRRSGAIKKASELCTLCGAQLAVIVQSRTKRNVYSFGNPDVYEVVNRYLNLSLNPASSSASSSSQYVQNIRDAKANELYAELTSLESELQSKKKAGEELKKRKKESQEQYWWDDMENAGSADLEQLKMAMSQLQEAAQKHLEKHEA